ncbi:MAG: hypothetical protein IPM89_03375 [Candidatus Competibacteraceae bacterium]|nr:MAG: hypothetical protein IPM89_03375 [Candidatus Competibacteraceae bacterium]
MKMKSRISYQSVPWAPRCFYPIFLFSMLFFSFISPIKASIDINQIQAINLLQTAINQSIHLENMQLDGESTLVNFQLERFEVFAPDAQIVVRDSQDHEQIHPRPSTAYFQGQIAGDPHSLVVLSADPDGTIRGIAQQDGKFWILAGGVAVGGPPLGLTSQELSQSGRLAGLPSFKCGVEGRMQELTPPSLQNLGNLPVEPLPAGQFYQVPIAIETDGEFYDLFGNSSSATSYIGDLFAYASTVYNREASTKLIIGSVSLWSGGPTSDPWNHTSTQEGLYNFRDYWNANRTGVSRATAHFLSGRSLGGGIAYLGVLCNNTYGYGYSANITGGFQIGNPQPVWDIIVVTHEIGHNFNSPHTHCYSGIDGNSNPVDACYNNEQGSGCWSGTTSLPGINSLTGGTTSGGNGTIMSYCHQISGGLSNIALTFGQSHSYGIAPHRVSSRIASYVAEVATANPSCITVGTSGTTYLLSVTKTGTGSGTVTSNPAGINCGADCSESYTAGTAVTLTASPVSGSIFAGWSGACSGTGACTVTLNAAQSVTATFNTGGGGDAYEPDNSSGQAKLIGAGATQTHSIDPVGDQDWVTFTLAQASGVVLETAGTAGDTELWLYNSSLVQQDYDDDGGINLFSRIERTCAATPLPAGAYYVKVAEYSNSATISSYTLAYQATPCSASSYILTVTKAGTGSGTVTSNPAGINCGSDCSESYSSGTTVTLTAGPASGSTFAGWSGICSGTGSCVVTMNAAKSVNASFNTTAPNTYLLTVNKSGTGSGTVTSNPSGINCGADCSESYNAGTTVTLTASPASGSTFAGWSGICSGTGSCVVIMNAAKSVNASFNITSQTSAQHTVGLYNPATGTFYLRNSNTAGVANIAFRYGPANVGWIPLAGDWDDNGTATAGLYNPATSTFYLRNSNNGGVANIAFRYGPANVGWIPLVGDWDGDGDTTVGLFNPATGTFYLRNSNNGGVANIAFRYGPANAGWIPLVGDWDGNGTDTVGLFDPATSAFYLRNLHRGGAADVSFRYGPANVGWTPLVGDWDGNDTATVGLFNPATSTFYLRNLHRGGAADVSFRYGPANVGWTPLAGDWNGPGL